MADIQPDSAFRILYFSVMIMSFSLGSFLLKYRDRTGSLALSCMTFTASLWSGTLFTQTLVGSFWTKHLYVLIGIAGSVGAIATFVFAFQYTGKDSFITKRLVGLLLIQTIAVILLTIFNPNNLFFTQGYVTDGLIGYQYEWGPLFIVNALYTWSLSIIAMIIILSFVIRSHRRLYKGQAAALVVGTFSPFISTVPIILEVTTVDTTPVGMFVATSLYAIAFTKYGLGRIAPVGRARVVDSIRDGVFLVDEKDNIVDSNNIGAKLFGKTESDDVIGKNAGYIFSNNEEFYNIFKNASENNRACQEIIKIDPYIINVDINELSSDFSSESGWIILLQDITKQKKKEEQLERQIEQLNRFTSIVSHDLRNPMAVAQGYVEKSIQDGTTDDLDKSVEAINRMDQIISDVLEMAKGGQVVTDPDKVSLRSVAIDSWRNVETADNHSLSINDTEDILADETQLKRLFENLYRNSIEHGISDFDSELNIEIGFMYQDNTEYAFYVCDDGEGIPENKRKKVFKSGYTTDEDGTGFGLMIIDQIARSHGWDIELDESDTGGAKFIFKNVRKKEPENIDIKSSNISNSESDKSSCRN